MISFLIRSSVSLDKKRACGDRSNALECLPSKNTKKQLRKKKTDTVARLSMLRIQYVWGEGTLRDEENLIDGSWSSIFWVNSEIAAGIGKQTVKQPWKSEPGMIIG